MVRGICRHVRPRNQRRTPVPAPSVLDTLISQTSDQRAPCNVRARRCTLKTNIRRVGTQSCDMRGLRGYRRGSFRCTYPCDVWGLKARQKIQRQSYLTESTSMTDQVLSRPWWWLYKRKLMQCRRPRIPGAGLRTDSGHHERDGQGKTVNGRKDDNVAGGCKTTGNVRCCKLRASSAMRRPPHCK